MGSDHWSLVQVVAICAGLTTIIGRENLLNFFKKAATSVAFINILYVGLDMIGIITLMVLSLVIGRYYFSRSDLDEFIKIWIVAFCAASVAGYIFTIIPRWSRAILQWRKKRRRAHEEIQCRLEDAEKVKAKVHEVWLKTAGSRKSPEPPPKGP